MIKLRTILSVIFLSISALALHAQVDAERLRSHITYLASQELAGRKAGTTGDSMAAAYIRNEFAKAGAQLKGEQGFQYFSLIAGVKLGFDNKFLFSGNEAQVNTGFMPLSFSATAGAEAEVVFAGFGITGKSGELSWDDYATLDVKGKWVMVLRGDPEPQNQNSAFIPMATERAKALTARDNGAAGLILVSPTSLEKKDVPLELNYDKTVSDAGLPVFSVTRNLAAQMLQLPLQAIDSLEQVMISSQKPVSFNLNVNLNAHADVVREKVISRNVMACIPGSDPLLKKEYIVIGAHYDHLGMGGPGSGSRVPDVHAVHGGADDNASGVASLIELARWFSKPENKPARSLLFVSFGAEEMGLLGARHFVANAPVDIKSIKAMINLDMVGRLKTDQPILTVSGTGTFAEANPILDAQNGKFPFEIKKVTDGYGPSDHAAFYGEGIPVLFLSTGAHGDYHTPDDSVEKINFTGQVSVTEFVAELVESVSAMKQAPVFTEAGARKQTGHYGRAMKVKLGIMPDVSGAETAGGMKVEGVSKGEPADRGGMLKGDIITAIDGLPVANVFDYMSRLGKLKAGDIVNIEVLRNGVKEVLIIQL